MSLPAVKPGRSIAHRIITRVALSRLRIRFLRDIGSRVDPTLLRLTQGRVSSVWPFPAVVMTHGGAKTGRTHTNALVYFTDRGRVILIASNFGGSRNPAWYHNVKTNPIVTLYGRGIRGHFIAEEVHGAERDRLLQRKRRPLALRPVRAGRCRQIQMHSCRCVYAAKPWGDVPPT